MHINQAVQDVLSETVAQDAKWGANRCHPYGLWSLILVEEVGEFAQAVLQDKTHEEIREELVQVAAVALQAIDAIDKENILGQS